MPSSSSAALGARRKMLKAFEVIRRKTGHRWSNSATAVVRICSWELDW